MRGVVFFVDFFDVSAEGSVKTVTHGSRAVWEYIHKSRKGRPHPEYSMLPRFYLALLLAVGADALRVGGLCTRGDVLALFPYLFHRKGQGAKRSAEAAGLANGVH